MPVSVLALGLVSIGVFGFALFVLPPLYDAACRLFGINGKTLNGAPATVPAVTGGKAMQPWFLAVTGLAFAALAPPLAAHSLKDVESDLNRDERYAQFVDMPAPDFRLIDLAGKPVSLGDLKGKVVVLNFIYSRCTDVCPLHMNFIARLQSMVDAAHMRERVRFVTIATDTEDAKATRKIMASYAKTYRLDTRNWQFLFRTDTAPADTTQAVAEAYGLKFTPVGAGVQMHGVVTHVIDQTGQLRARFHGLKFEPVHLVAYVGALVNDDHSKQLGRLQGS